MKLEEMNGKAGSLSFNEEAPVDWYQQLKSKFDAEYVKLYGSGNAHISFSSMKHFRTAPLLFVKNKVWKPKRTKALDDGTLIHALLFEPQKFKDQYAAFDDTEFCKKLLNEGYKDENGKTVEVKTPRATAVYKDWKKRQMELIGNKQMVDIDMLKRARAAFSRAMANQEFVSVLKAMKNRRPENKFMTTVGKRKFPLLGYKDLDSENIVLDLKFVTDNSLRGTYRDYWGTKMWTFVQQGLYSSVDGFNKDHYVIYMNHQGDVRVREVPKDALRLGFDVFDYWVGKLDEVITSGTFMYDSQFWDKPDDNVLSVPAWSEELY